ncbi:class I SAM-dependent methyltransferase [Methanocella sp. MCL-LM]|uniref:SAM-dependent methyltransferase n=1 Tax=Methanocella sp. MCL-LM TaxID=3412035 RepID=UPI003C793DCD
MDESPTCGQDISTVEVHKRINRYFTKTQALYELIWMTQDSLAMHYGVWNDSIKNINDAQINENQLVADCLKLESSDIVLDAGCGVCGSALWMAEKYGCKIRGITISDKQVEHAKKFIRQRKMEDRVTAEMNDFCNTGYPDQSFTKVFGIESICYAPKKADFLKEAYRLLKPKGRLVVADAFLPREELADAEKKMYEDWCEGWAVPGLETIGGFKQQLRAAGFDNIEFRDITKYIMPSSSRIWWINIPFYYPYKLLYPIRLVSRTIYMDMISSVYQKDLFENRTFTYCIASAEKP